MPSEVYSWRVSSELKSTLEREARLRKTSVSGVLKLAVEAWLERSGASSDGDEEQSMLHQAAAACLGAFASRNALRSETARETIRKRLKARNER